MDLAGAKQRKQSPDSGNRRAKEAQPSYEHAVKFEFDELVSIMLRDVGKVLLDVY